MEFSRQEYWNGLPFLSPGDLSSPGTEPMCPMHFLHCRWILYHWGTWGNIQYWAHDHPKPFPPQFFHLYSYLAKKILKSFLTSFLYKYVYKSLSVSLSKYIQYHTSLDCYYYQDYCAHYYHFQTRICETIYKLIFHLQPLSHTLLLNTAPKVILLKCKLDRFIPLLSPMQWLLGSLGVLGDLGP